MEELTFPTTINDNDAVPFCISLGYTNCLSFIKFLNIILLSDIQYADIYLLIVIIILIVLIIAQKLNIFTRPPNVPTKLLPRRPVLQVLFKPDDVIGTANTSSSSTVGGGESAGISGQQQQQNIDDGISLFSEDETSTTWDGKVGGSPIRIREQKKQQQDGNTNVSTTRSSAERSATSSAAQQTRQQSVRKQKQQPKKSAILHGLPDSFAPLLSSSEMEVLTNGLTADLIHAVQIQAQVKLRQGRHIIPLDKDERRPQFWFDSKSSNNMTSETDATSHTDNTSTQKGCKVSASITVGSERFTNEEDLDTTRHTTTRSRPMVKSADLIFDSPLRLGNVAPTLLHFPNLFEDRALPKLRRMQVIGFIIEFLASCWYLLEKLLWIIESKCQVHLGRVKATPIFRGRTSDGTAQWRLSLSFTGHLLLFDWLPIPFISFQLPTFIIPQPHALMEYLMTKQPLASARLRRENISDEKIAVAALNALDSWSTNVKAVVTPPAVEVDLTMAGGITLSFEMMHGREVASSHKAATSGRDSPTSPGMIPREISSNSLTSWSKTDSLRMRSVNVPTSGRVAPGKVFDANSLTPWYLETSIDGSLSKDKIGVNVSRCLGRHEDEYAAIPSRSMFTLSGSVIVARAKENACVPGPSSGRTLLKRQLSNANQNNYPPIHALLLFPDAYVPSSNRSSQHLVEYDYAFDVGEETNLDAVSLSYGASHPMLKGGTIISCMLESIYAYGSIFAREGSLADPSVQVRKRNILRHLPACDFTAGISNTYLPKQGINYFDDGNTRSIPEMEGGRVMFRIIGGLDESMLRGNDDSTNPPILVKEGVKLIADFGVSSFSQKSETKVNEFPELEIFEGSKLVSTILGSVDGSITCHLRPQSEVTESSSSSGPNVFNPLEAYEIDFSGSAVSLRIKESSFNLDHRRIIVPTESTFALKVQQSVVNMMFEGKTECELVWDFQGSSPILQTTPQGQTPALSNHEDRKQANLLIKDLRQGRLNLEVSSVGGISFNQAETVREDKVGLYDWKFFNAIVSPDDDSPSRIMDVLHDKKTMHQLLAVMKLVNFDIERAFRYFLTKVWRAKEILDEEGISDPGQAIPNYKVARLISLFLCEDTSQVDEVLPIIRRIVAGNGLDVIKVKELLRKHVEAYDEWAAEMDRAVKWAAVALGPMAVQQPIEETETPPLSECLDFSRYEGIPTAKELYQTLQGSPQLPLDQSFSSLVSRIAPYMTLRQVRYILHLRPASHWQPFDLKRLRYVYSIKKKVAEISESYGGLSFMPQSFFVSIFLGEATRSSLRASTQVNIDDNNDTDPEVSKGGNKRTGLSVLRQRKFGQSLRNTGSDSDLENFIMSPAGRIASVHASMNNLANMHTTTLPDRHDVTKEISPVVDEMLGDSLLGPQDIAILLQAGLTSAVKGSTVVQLNQRMLLDLMASQPRSFAIAVLAELGNDGPRPLASALMALCDLDQGSFKEAHRINMHNLLESWLPGLRIPNREDYLAGGRWARSSFYDAIYSVAINILDLTETYRGLKLRVQQVRHHQETDPLPIPMENSSDFKFQPTSKLTSAIETAITNISTADDLGRIALDDLIQKRKTSSECTEAIAAYKEAFTACSQVLAIDKLAFQADWFKSFFRRNYDALMIKSIYDNVMDDVDSVRYWLEALRRGNRGIGVTPDNESLNTSPLSGSMDALDVDPARIIAMDSLSSKPFFMCPGKQGEQDLIDGIIEALFYDETERNDLMNDPLVRLLISNEPGHYNFTLVSAMGVITEGEKGTELRDAFDRLEKERGIVTIRADTGTARSIDYNASKIEEAVETAAKLKRPYGLLGYSQGCANEFNFESRMISGTPDQQEVLSGLVCRQLLFSAANGSMHGPSAEAKVHQLITMCEDFFKYQQGYFSRAFISSTLEGLNGILDSAAFQKFLGGAKSFFPDALRQFWREAQHLPHIPTTVLRGVLETHTTPESLEMICNMLAKQSGSALHDSQVHVYDAVGHPVYVKNRNGRILKSTDMGGSIQRTHHWSPLSDEVEFVRTKRDVQQGIFDCAKDRHIFPWVDVNARFGIIKYTTELDKDKESSK